MSIEQHFMIKTSLQINNVGNYRWHWDIPQEPSLDNATEKRWYSISLVIYQGAVVW